MAKGIPGLLKDGSNLTLGVGDTEGGAGANGIFVNCPEDDVGSAFTNGVGVTGMLGGAQDPITFETPFPACMVPGPVSPPGRIPYRVPFMEMLPFLPVAVAALGASLIATAVEEGEER